MNWSPQPASFDKYYFVFCPIESVGLTYRIVVSTDLGVTDPWVGQPSNQTMDTIEATPPCT
jgi:hypothetical protein